MAITGSARALCWALAVGAHAMAFAVAPRGTEPATVIPSDSPAEPTIDVDELSPPAGIPAIAPGAVGAPRTPTPPPAERARAATPVPAHESRVPPSPDVASRGAIDASAAPKDVRPAPARFVMAVVAGGVAQRTVGTASSSGAPDESDIGGGGGPQAPLSEREVSSTARCEWTKPKYTPEAVAQEVEADVVLSVVVSSSGAVAEARSVKHVGYGLDEAAERAYRAARCTPALRDGKAVAERKLVKMTFGFE
jgi:TonB family protein